MKTMVNLRTRQFKAVSSTRRQHYSGQKQNTYYRWDVSIEKSILREIGWWSSAPEDVFFVTHPSDTNKYCELELWSGRIPIPAHVHKLRAQLGERVQLSPYFGPGARWDRLEPHDPDTQCEFFPETGRIRIFYPPALVPFQSNAFASESLVRKAMRA